ncbi:SGNH/GDSL hydrolase family protein [Thauera butanivorans]|uniref:SGNH/GDSL hydrolase family protein n=1 Tax=Thauera butanivorans TaxID=86174 RepID=UPI000AE4339E|nr:SGNH/GDSL hydrolase family protein [Thauera butanivorans]
MIRILLLAATLLFAPLSHAAYTSMYVFGDSLSDNGNAYALSGGIWPVSPPYAEQFSDGPTAAEYLAGRLGIDLRPSTAGGTNFAVGGATSGTQNYNYEISSPAALPPALGQSGALAQVAGFVGSAPAFDPASSLFMLWAAPNDFFLALSQGTDLLAAAGTAVSNLITSVGLLASAGATDILVPNMPNLSRTPFGLSLEPQQQAALDALSRGFNDALADALDLARSGFVPGIPGGLRLMFFDTAAFLDEVISDAARFGFTDVVTPCVTSPAGCEGALFFDGVHPTTAGHRLLADRFLAAIAVPEPPTGTLLLAALAGVLLMRRRP